MLGDEIGKLLRGVRIFGRRDDERQFGSDPSPFRDRLDVIIDENLFGHAGLADDFRHFRSIALLEIEVDIYPTLDGGERLLKSRDSVRRNLRPFCIPDVQGPQLPQCHLRDRAVAVSHTIDCAIVHQDVVAIRGTPDIDLDVIDSRRDGVFDSCLGVFMGTGVVASVGDHSE